MILIRSIGLPSCELKKLKKKQCRRSREKTRRALSRRLTEGFKENPSILRPLVGDQA